LYRAIGFVAIAAVTIGLAAGAIISRANTEAVPAAAPSTASNPYWEYVEDVPIEAPQAASNPFANDTHVYTMWDFREDRRVPPTVLSVEEQRFLELNTQLPVGTLPVSHNSTSDLGTEYDPYVIGSSQPRYVPAQQGSITGETPCPLGGTAPCGQVGTQLPEEASITGTYRWNFGSGALPVPPLGPVQAFDWEQQERTQVAPGPVAAFDWEQQERTQVAPGAVPSATVPIPGSGPCRPGSSDCQLDEVFTVGVLPTPPSVYAGACRAGSSDCLPDGDYPFAETPATSPAGTHGTGPADEYGQTGSGVAAALPCIFASSTGAPGEGCNY
jgi:hypothetical protein